MATNSSVTFVNDSDISTVVRENSGTIPKVHVAQLKQNRSVAKRNVTKIRNEIELIIANPENATEIAGKIPQLQSALEVLKRAHALYHQTLQKGDDIQNSLQYLQNEETKVKNLIAKIENAQTSLPNEQPTNSNIPVVEPSDSVSSTGTKKSSSGSSSTSSARVKAAVRTATLQAKADALKRLQTLQQEELRLQQKKEELELETELAIAQAEESALADVQSSVSSKGSSSKSTAYVSSWLKKSNNHAVPFDQSPVNPKQHSPVANKLNPEAKEWQSPFSNYLPQPTPYTSQIENLLMQQQQHTLALMLPQPELPTFAGDPAEYCSFIRAFESLIESRTNSSSARLYYLVQYTKGDVHELMRSCLSMNHEEGYHEARRLLKQRFGQDYKIATAYVDKITTGPPIRAEKAEDLRKFSILITSCKNTLRDIGYLNRVNNPDCLKRIIERLPFEMKRKWRDVADDISEHKHREITIEDVALFIEKRARAASHPIFGEISKPQKSSNSNVRTTGRGAVFGISGESKTNSDQGKIRNLPQCPLCNSNHWLSRCSQFRSKSVSERFKVTRTKGLCNNCLLPGHLVKECPKESFCKVDGCKQKHSTFLHPVNPKQSEATNQSIKKPEADTEMSGHNGYIKVREDKNIPRAKTSLSIVPVKVSVPGSKRVVETYAFLDSGSNTTFCTKDLMDQLSTKGTDTMLSLTTLGIADNQTKTSVLSLQVSDLDENNLIDLPVVFSTPRLPVTIHDRANYQDLEKWPHLQEINLIDIDAQVGLLIGSDVPRALEPREVKSGQPGQPYATRTDLGWVVNGPLKRSGSSRSTVSFIKTDADLTEQFQKYCEMEFNDSCYDSKAAMSQEDKIALEKMKSTIQLKNGHYEIGLPWKDGFPDLPNNRSMAEYRLQHLKKRLEREPTLLKNYTSFIDDLLQKGYAQKAPKSAGNGGTTWFLPHHPVFNPKKPEKTRVVFDCSAKYQNVSLNSQLSQGPDLTSTLVGVLTRFRTGPVALMADIEGMFLQVKVPDKDADSLRFLWWPDGDLNSDPEEYQMLVHLFGGTSSPSCASFALQQTAEQNKKDFDPVTIETVKRNFYVDDCLKSVGSEEQAIQLQRELRQLLSRGGFRLTKWMSNSVNVLEAVPELERAASVKNLDLENSKSERALGVCWDVSNDEFGFNITMKEKQPTRRGILSVVSSIYDPLGFAAPFILQAKAILQELCRQKLNWDDNISEKDLHDWNNWMCDLPKLEDYKIDRCFQPKGSNEIATVQLHHFSDASQIGYGAVSYIRIVNARGDIHCCFIMAKSRLAPIKSVTIPRMELSAAVVATRLDTMIRQETDLHIDQSYFWTDSTCVLRYIENEEKRFQTFVANRISTIRNVSVPSQWYYVDTKANPADDASRGLTAKDLIENKRWLYGPEFLWGPEEEWPQRPASMGSIPNNDPEIKKSAKSFATESEEGKDTVLDNIINRHSSWYNLKKTIAWLIRYKTNLKEAVSKRKMGTSTKSRVIKPLKISELRKAETVILQYVQKRSFPSEMKLLSTNQRKENGSTTSQRAKNPVGKNSSLQRLDPFISDDGILRVGGRLRRALISDESKHQIILPKRHHIVELIVRYYHEVSGHSGLEYVLALTRQRYWIIRARSTLKQILNKCFSCRRRQSPVEAQKMADLPKDRVTPSKPPFSFVGIDCFGPFQVRRGRTMVKRYGVIFTCLSIRAIHIEIAHALDTSSFINAFRRFIARRGCPEEIRSDNGTNFVGGNKELSQAISEWNESKMQEFLLQKSIKWTFNPPAGSHHGGVWERCIRTVRKVMNAILKEQTLDDEGLLTLMCEVEAIVNGRPITKVSDDPSDWEALTPNHLLLLRAGPTLPPGIFDKNDCYTRRRWRQVQYLADIFWRRWLKEYLPTLQQRQRWNKSKRNLQVDDIVLIVDESLPRNQWQLGRIVEVHKSNQDGYVRSIKVKTRTSLLVRPIDKIVLLESVEQEDGKTQDH